MHVQAALLFWSRMKLMFCRFSDFYANLGVSHFAELSVLSQYGLDPQI